MLFHWLVAHLRVRYWTTEGTAHATLPSSYVPCLCGHCGDELPGRADDILLCTHCIQRGQFNGLCPQCEEEYLHPDHPSLLGDCPLYSQTASSSQPWSQPLITREQQFFEVATGHDPGSCFHCLQSFSGNDLTPYICCVCGTYACIDCHPGHQHIDAIDYSQHPSLQPPESWDDVEQQQGYITALRVWSSEEPFSTSQEAMLPSNDSATETSLPPVLVHANRTMPPYA